MFLLAPITEYGRPKGRRHGPCRGCQRGHHPSPSERGTFISSLFSTSHCFLGCVALIKMKGVRIADIGSRSRAQGVLCLGVGRLCFHQRRVWHSVVRLGCSSKFVTTMQKPVSDVAPFLYVVIVYSLRPQSRKRQRLGHTLACSKKCKNSTHRLVVWTFLKAPSPFTCPRTTSHHGERTCCILLLPL